jgi:ribosomal protein S18 acetylase RimI-like enzyme
MIRQAGIDDVDHIARLLHAFNTEYGDPTPDPPQIAERLRVLLRMGDTSILLSLDTDPTRPDALAVMRFRESIWSEALECYLAELYVVPELRGRGIGGALLEAAMEHARERGADFMDLGTSEDDVAARGLYEKLGFTNRERPDGPVMYVYEREL